MEEKKTPEKRNILSKDALRNKALSARKRKANEGRDGICCLQDNGHEGFFVIIVKKCKLAEAKYAAINAAQAAKNAAWAEKNAASAQISS